MTNFEKITQNTETLAEILDTYNTDYCINCIARDCCEYIEHYVFTGCANIIKKWLEQEVNYND